MSFLFKPTTLTSTSQNQQSQTGSSSSAGSTQATLSPELQALMNQLMAYGTTSMTDPMGTLAPIRRTGLQQINRTYADIPGQVTRQMSSRGYGSSGAMGNAMFRTGLERAGAISNLEGQLADRGIQQSQFGASLSDQLINAMRGTSTSASANSAMSGTSSGTQTQPGPSIFGTLLGLASTVTGAAGTAGGFGKLFGGGGGGGGGAEWV